jgi:hypothetical protein
VCYAVFCIWSASNLCVKALQTGVPGQHNRIEERECVCVRACVWVGGRLGYVTLDWVSE